MKDGRFRCAGCQKMRPARVKGQRYCGASACQQARKNAWRQEKYATDADYRATHKESTRAWLVSVGGAATYYRQYRKLRRGKQQRLVGSATDPADLVESGRRAKRDAISTDSPVKTGHYLLVRVGDAKRDATFVEIRAISIG